MTSEGSVTHWLGPIQEGEQEAAQKLWERYFDRLVRLSCKFLRDTPRGMADEEDVALSAFDSFCRAAKRGRFPSLSDRQELWRILVKLAARKSIDLNRHEHAQRRDARRRRGGETSRSRSHSGFQPLQELVGHTPTPEFAAIMAEQCEKLLQDVGDDELRDFAVAKLEGYSNKEIAGRFGRPLRTVERRLRLVRAKWKEKLEQ